MAIAWIVFGGVVLLFIIVCIIANQTANDSPGTEAGLGCGFLMMGMAIALAIILLYLVVVTIFHFAGHVHVQFGP